MLHTTTNSGLHDLTPLSWSDTQVEVTVPNLTPAGPNYLSITVGGLQSIRTYPFQATTIHPPNSLRLPANSWR
jgi:hypothetical protein